MNILDDVSPTILRYVRMAATPDAKKQSEQSEKLAIFIKNQKGNKRRVQRKFESREFKEPTDQYLRNKTIVKFLFSLSCDLIQKKFDFEIRNLTSTIETASKMHDIVAKNAKIIVDLNDFVNDTQETFKNNEDYLRIKFQRRSITRKVSRIQMLPAESDIIESIRSGILTAVNLYDDNLTYSPPSEFDNLIYLYIMASKFKSMVFSIANFIAYGHADDAFLNTIGEFTNDLYVSLKLNSNTAQVIIFTSAIRFLFDEAYVIQSDLRGYNKANAEFLVKCDIFSRQPARELKLSSDIESYYTPGLPITSLFKSKQQMLLKDMEYMTNPIDLMVRVHVVINSLAQYFGSEIGVLSFDDTLTLFLGLMSLSPPANAFAIAKFVEKWSDLQLSDVIRNSQNFYTVAIDHILKLENIQVADDAQEFFY